MYILEGARALQIVPNSGSRMIFGPLVREIFPKMATAMILRAKEYMHTVTVLKILFD